MDGYRFSVERHRLLVALERAKDEAGCLPDGDRARRVAELERDFRRRLDALYDEARGEFEPPCGR